MNGIAPNARSVNQSYRAVMEHALSPTTLTELRRPRPYPAVSVLTPTHRREPYRAQDQVRLRNVVAEAKKQLESDPSVTRERRADVLAEDQVQRPAGLVLERRGEDGCGAVERPTAERLELARGCGRGRLVQKICGK